MAELEQRLATLKHLLFRTDLYEKLICDKGYEKLGTRKYRNNFNSLRNSIEFEISQILESLKAEDIEYPRGDFSFREVRDCLKNETKIGSLIAELNKISPEATSLLDLLPDAVSDLYDEFIPAQSVQGKLYRHGVCHGLQTDFGSKKNSLRLILLLDRIIFFYAMT